MAAIGKYMTHKVLNIKAAITPILLSSTQLYALRVPKEWGAPHLHVHDVGVEHGLEHLLPRASQLADPGDF